MIRITAQNAVPYSLLFPGSVALVFSVLYSSYILAFVGLGLVFWGTLFLYIKPTRYVRLELLNAASFSTLTNIERMLASTKTYEKGIYLPPKNLQDSTSSLVFIPTTPNQALPTSAETTPQQLQSQNPTGLLITPPRLALSKLLEKELRHLFTETTLEDLQDQLPKLFDDLQITRSIILTTQTYTITVTTSNNIFRALSEETKQLEKTQLTVGSPLSSALACVFAKATRKPVTIEKEETNPEGTITMQFNILEN